VRHSKDNSIHEQYDFDRELDRVSTHADKWNFLFPPGLPGERYRTDRFKGPDRAIPLWVADMDFPAPRPVVEALAARVKHGIFGYAGRPPSYDQAVVDWMQRRHGWTVDPTWLLINPGVLPALYLIVDAFTGPEDKVLIQSPVYFPFYNVIQRNGRQVVTNPLIYENGRYKMDFQDLAEKARDPRLKLAILCSPHNPVGRVWTPEELKRFGEICLANDVLVAADEIHSDLVYSGHTFTPYGTLGESLAQTAFICTSTSKTFNLAGLRTANTLVPNEALRDHLNTALQAHGLHAVSLFGMLALEAAYREGEPWLTQLLAYLEVSIKTMADFFADRLPQVTLIPPEGTHLAWLDCRGLDLGGANLQEFFLEEAGVFLEGGAIFGPEGQGFVRLNFACPRPLLVEAMERMAAAVERRSRD
jgi:cystathionine beta-lyase